MVTSVNSTNFLTALGAGSGIDSKALAQSLADVQIAPKKDLIKAQIAKTEAKISAYGYIKTALSDLKTAFSKLDDASDFLSTKVANTQPLALSVTSSNTGNVGSYNINVSQLASAQRSVSNSFTARDTALNAGNSFNLNLTIGNGEAQIIEVTNDTPIGIVNAINGQKLGVTAQLLNTGNGYSIVLTGETGASKSFNLTADTVQTDVLNFSTITQQASDAVFSIDGLSFTKSSNTVSDAIEGITFELRTTTNGTARIDLTRETSAIKDNLKALVTAYNDFEITIKELGNSKSVLEDVGGALVGDNTLMTLKSQIRNLITNQSSTPGSSITAARDTGISFDRNGKMTLDESKLDSVLLNKFDQVVQAFTANSNNKSIYSSAPGGIGGDAVNSIDKLLRSTGLVNTLNDNAAKEVDQYKLRLNKLDDQLKVLLERYTKQFAAMDAIVSNSNSTRTSLKSTFDAMNNSKD